MKNGTTQSWLSEFFPDANKQFIAKQIWRENIVYISSSYCFLKWDCTPPNAPIYDCCKSVVILCYTDSTFSWSVPFSTSSFSIAVDAASKFGPWTFPSLHPPSHRRPTVLTFHLWSHHLVSRQSHQVFFASLTYRWWSQHAVGTRFFTFTLKCAVFICCKHCQLLTPPFINVVI